MLYLPPLGHFWVFFSGNLINPWPGPSFPLAGKEGGVNAEREFARGMEAGSDLLMGKGLAEAVSVQGEFC